MIPKLKICDYVLSIFSTTQMELEDLPTGGHFLHLLYLKNLIDLLSI